MQPHQNPEEEETTHTVPNHVFARAANLQLVGFINRLATLKEEIESGRLNHVPDRLIVCEQEWPQVMQFVRRAVQAATSLPAYGYVEEVGTQITGEANALDRHITSFAKTISQIDPDLLTPSQVDQIRTVISKVDGTLKRARSA